MSFSKIYLKTAEEIKAVPPGELWRCYIAREYFLAVPIADNQDKLASDQDMDKFDIKREPIWLDDRLDEEGVAYSKYLKKKSLPGWMRFEAAKRLKRANNSLHTQGYELVLKAGFRPLEVQWELFREVYKDMAQQNPNAGESELTNMTRDYVSDPSQICPPHVSGAAVDVMIRDDTGNIVDMGCPVNSGQDIAWAGNTDITASQAANRKILRDAMLEVGFAPLASEWWHYSYGDQLWAAYYGKPNALYDIIK